MKFTKIAITIIMVLSIFLIGCQTTDPLAGYCSISEKAVVVCEPIKDTYTSNSDNITDIVTEEMDDLKTIDTTNNSEETINKETENVTSKDAKTEDISDVNIDVTKEYFEGDLIKLTDFKITDLDNDAIKITYTTPLTQEGEWQTETGDAGEYITKITASDGIDTVDAYVKLIVLIKNSAPKIEIENSVSVLEGEEITLNPVITDSDGDDITKTYSGFMTSPVYQTTFDDAGVYTVTITATDGSKTTTKDVKITVIEVNRAPLLSAPTVDIIATEGDIIKLPIIVADLDEDEIFMTYSKPFNEEGEWQTETGDAGEYTITVTATDNKDESQIMIPIIVSKLNNAPTLKVANELTVDEGEVVSITAIGTDTDGDDTSLTFSGWMNSNTYQTTYDDAGEYIVTVTLSDGIDEVSKEVKITVNNVNRPPEFIWE